MAFREFERLSPNRDPAPHERLGALFHHSELGFGETIERMLNPGSRVSYHCLIDADGTRCTLVPDGEVAWHAGASRFLGRDRCNDFMLGVAFAGDTDAAPFPARSSHRRWNGSSRGGRGSGGPPTASPTTGRSRRAGSATSTRHSGTDSSPPSPRISGGVRPRSAFPC